MRRGLMSKEALFFNEYRLVYHRTRDLPGEHQGARGLSGSLGFDSDTPEFCYCSYLAS